MEFLYEYFDRYYYSDDENEKEQIFEDFFDELWKSPPKFRKIPIKNGFTCRNANRTDSSPVFLKSYINRLYAKYCCSDTMVDIKKMDYTYAYFHKMIKIYIRRMFKNYIPSSEYERLHPSEEIDAFYDGWGDDSYVCSYVCRSLKGYMDNRRKRYYHPEKYKDCECGEQIKKKTPNSRIKYCEKCAKQAKNKQSTDSAKRTKMGRYKRWPGKIIG